MTSKMFFWLQQFLIVFMAVQTAIKTGGSTGAIGTAPVNQTWYVNQNGGTDSQCTGLTNAPYPGSGSSQPCAFVHPFYLMNTSTFASWKIAGGDTVMFTDSPSTPHTYYMGQTLNGLGTSWPECAFSLGAALCMLPALPSGTAGHLTTFLGQNAGSCHTHDANGNPVGLVNPTVLSGLNGVFEVLNFQSTAYADVECIEVTQPDVCTSQGNSTNNIIKTSLSSGTGTYITELGSSYLNNPLPTQRLNISGTTNGGGALNGTNLSVNSFTQSQWSITQSSATSTTLTLNYTVVSGDVPRVGLTFFALAGLTNAGGSYNTSFGNGTIATSSGTSTGTFTITGSFTPAFSQAESGTGEDFTSGTMTITGLSGSASIASDTGSTTPTGHCVNGVNNYVQHGIRFEYLTNQGPSNITLKDIAVVGISNQGILGSKVNVLSGDVSTFSDIYVIGNGGAGWDNDGGGCGTSCESQGTMNLTDVDVEWNGCEAAGTYNIGLPTSSNIFDYCYAQSTSGYGDGFAFIAANTNLFITHSVFRNNTQDGFDGAHLGDDLTQHPTEIVTYSIATGNMGSTFKLGPVDTAELLNDFSNGNCRFLVTASNFPSNPSGWAAGLQNVQDSCRAAGDQVPINIKDGETVTVQNNTFVGQGATMFDMGCATGSCVGSKAIFRNNVMKGYVDPNSGQLANSFYFGSNPDMFGLAGSVLTNTLWDTMRSTGCLQDPNEVNCNYADPLFVAESTVDSVNPNLQAGSPAINAGTATGCPATDFNGKTQTSPCTEGAYVH